MLPTEITWKLADLDVNDLDLTKPEDLQEFEYYLAEAISDATGYCHHGFDYELENDSVTVYDIAYDIDDDEEDYEEEDQLQQK